MATLFAGRVACPRRERRHDGGRGRAGRRRGVHCRKDVPVNEYGLQIKDQPVLCGPGCEAEREAGADVVRFVGDQVALVVAETEAQARARAS